MEQYLIQLATIHTYWTYGIIMVLSSVEGPILSLAGGALIKLGYFPFIPLYVALMIGDLLGDTLWYYIGYIFGNRFIRRFGKNFDITEERVEKAKRVFHKHQLPILFINKVTMGFGFTLAILMAAGMMRISYWKYIVINAAGQFFWTGTLIAVGYFLGEAYQNVSSVLGKISIFGLFIMAILLLGGYGKYWKRRADKMNI